MDNSGLGDRIKTARLERGLSIRELSRRAEEATGFAVSISYISRLESGDDNGCTIRVLRRIAAGLNLHVCDLIGRD